MKGGGPQGDSDPVRAAGDRCSPPDVPSPSSPELLPCQGPAQVDSGMDEPCPWVVGHGASFPSARGLEVDLLGSERGSKFFNFFPLLDIEKCS